MTLGDADRVLSTLLGRNTELPSGVQTMSSGEEVGERFRSPLPEWWSHRVSAQHGEFSPVPPVVSGLWVSGERA